MMLTLQGLYRGAAASGLLSVALIFAASRLAFFGFVLLVHHNFFLGAPVLPQLCQFDCQWYATILLDVYDLAPYAHDNGNAANWAFFPLLPLGTMLMDELWPGGPLQAAFLLSNLALFGSLWLLYRYARLRLGWDEENARFAVLALAFSPVSLYFSIPYTESLFTLAALASLYFAAGGRFVSGGLAAAAASATRATGPFLVFPFLLLVLQRFRPFELLSLRPGTERAILGIMLVPLGTFLFMLFLHFHMGDAFAFKNIQIAWARIPGNPFSVLWLALAGGDPYLTYCALAGLGGLALAVYLALQRLWPESLLLVLGTLLPLSTSVQSLPRYVMGLFPVYLALALLTARHRALRAPLLALFATLGAFLTLSWQYCLMYTI